MRKQREQIQNVFCVDDVIKRAKLVRGFNRDTQLANYLGVSRSTLSNWIARNSVDFPLLLEKFSEVDYNWLLTGKGVPHHVSHPCEDRMAEGEVSMIHTPKSSEPMADRMVPLYNITAAANLKSVLEDAPQYILGNILIPNVPKCDGAITVAGDSMYPILKSGDIVGFKLISTFNEPGAFRYGEMYLVSFNFDDDEQLVLKYVNSSERPGYIKLVSYNTHHDPMDIPLSCVRSMAIVKFSIRKHTMM